MRRAKAPAYRESSSGERIPGTQSVYRAIAVLRGIARSNAAGVTASVLARELELTLATTHRLLKVLASEGLLTFDPYRKVREAAYAEALKRIADQVYWLPLFTYNVNYAYSADLDFTPSADEIPRFYRTHWK